MYTVMLETQQSQVCLHWTTQFQGLNTQKPSNRPLFYWNFIFIGTYLGHTEIIIKIAIGEICLFSELLLTCIFQILFSF